MSFVMDLCDPVVVLDRGRAIASGSPAQVRADPAVLDSYLARAMMLAPRLLLLDEPSMGLDPRTRTLVFETIGRLRREGRTVLLVEQNARSGLRLADRGVVMESGRVRLEGAGRELLDDPEIGELYLGRAG
jgi:branched-chain amino acid transport system ATP-binding protein